MPQNPTDSKSKFIPVIAWQLQAITSAKVDPDL